MVVFDSILENVEERILIQLPVCLYAHLSAWLFDEVEVDSSSLHLVFKGPSYFLDLLIDVRYNGFGHDQLPLGDFHSGYLILVVVEDAFRGLLNRDYELESKWGILATIKDPQEHGIRDRFEVIFRYAQFSTIYLGQLESYLAWVKDDTV